MPKTEQPFKEQPDPTKAIVFNERLRRLSAVATQDRTLQLAATQALTRRTLSPLSKLRETRGLVTLKRVADNFEVKQALAAKEYPNSGFKFAMPKPHVFRDTDPGSVLKLN